MNTYVLYECNCWHGDMGQGYIHRQQSHEKSLWSYDEIIVVWKGELNNSQG